MHGGIEDEKMKDYIELIILTSVICGAFNILLPKTCGGINKYLKLITALVTFTIIALPLLNFMSNYRESNIKIDFPNIYNNEENTEYLEGLISKESCELLVAAIKETVDDFGDYKYNVELKGSSLKNIEEITITYESGNFPKERIKTQIEKTYGINAVIKRGDSDI